MHLHLLEEELKEVTEERDNLVVKLQKNQKLVHQTEVLLVKRKPLEEELKEVKEERNNLMAKLQKNEKLVAELQGAVECPVCLVHSWFSNGGLEPLFHKGDFGRLWPATKLLIGHPP